MRRIELLVQECRRQTENEEFTESTGIPDNEFIQYLNDAQEQLQSDIIRNHENIFIKQATFDVVQGQSDYPMPDDAYINNRLNNVWFSHNGQRENMKLLKAGSLKERTYTKVGVPSIYIRSSGKIILSPVPQNSTANGMLIDYVTLLNKLDKRRGKIGSVVTTGNSITSLQLDLSDEIDVDAINSQCFICVVDKCGEVKMRRIKVLDVNSVTGDITVDPLFQFEDGETIAVGDYIVAGKFSTNMSELPDMCERYLIQYCNWKILKRDSSNDSGEASTEINEMRAEIVETFKEIDSDVRTVTITDTSFLDEDDLYIF